MKQFLEKDLEDIICNSDIDKLVDRGLNIDGKIFRQLNIGNYGIADIVTVSRDWGGIYKYNPELLIITVFELKKDTVGISAFLQGIRYCKGIKRYLEKRGFSNYKLNLTLIGSSIDKSGSFLYLPDLIGGESYNDNRTIENLLFYTYSYDIDGINFEQWYDYSLKNEGFNLKSK